MAGVEAEQTGLEAAAREGSPRLVFASALAGTTLLLGALECWFGKTDSGDVYGSDAVQYLDCARALVRHDWHAALNPLWSQGYPALLALARPMFVAGPWGDWLDTRLVNFLIFLASCLAFAFLLRELDRVRPWSRPGLVAASAVFVTTQLCLGQASRVGPDQLVAALFFLSCGLLLRLGRRPEFGLAALLGITLSAGFLAKAVFLVLGCLLLIAAAYFLRRRLVTLVPAAALFGVVVLSYGAALSRATGHRTLGEAGSLNYAWHVDRLSKWVHWEGGTDPAAQAWPKPSIARFTHWESSPPDFGTPLHPSQRVGEAPAIYVFHEPVTATYIPYYDPAYWYTGYRHVFNPRYQLVALAKNSADLLLVLLKQPIFYALLLLLGFNVRQAPRPARHSVWPLAVCATLAVMTYLPVHLEGRYLAPYLAVLATLLVAEINWKGSRGRILFALLLLTFFSGLSNAQHTVWTRAARGWSPSNNPEWQIANAVRATGLPSGTEIGMISWTPNLHCDWAYMAGLQITSEIASGPDQAAFWALPPATQAQTLARFHQAGAQAVLTADPPSAGSVGWQQLGSPGHPVRMWMHRF